jgi:hypothetical protein
MPAAVRCQLCERQRERLPVFLVHIALVGGAQELLQGVAENPADRFAAEDEATLAIELPDPVLDRVHDVTQPLLAVADPALGVTPADALDDFTERPLHSGNEPRRIRLEDVVDRTVMKRLNRTLLAQRARHEYERNVRRLAHGDLERGEAVETGDREVGDDDMRSETAQRGSEASLRVDPDVNRLDASRTQLSDGEVRVGRVILDDQYA